MPAAGVPAARPHARRPDGPLPPLRLLPRRQQGTPPLSGTPVPSLRALDGGLVICECVFFLAPFGFMFFCGFFMTIIVLDVSVIQFKPFPPLFVFLRHSRVQPSQCLRRNGGIPPFLLLLFFSILPGPVFRVFLLLFFLVVPLFLVQFFFGPRDAEPPCKKSPPPGGPVLSDPKFGSAAPPPPGAPAGRPHLRRRRPDRRSGPLMGLGGGVPPTCLHHRRGLS